MPEGRTAKTVLGHSHLLAESVPAQEHLGLVRLVLAGHKPVPADKLMPEVDHAPVA
jgi:hypothetical protein